MPLHLMRHDAPALLWRDGFPLGNGKVAAMAWGPGDEERFSLNHEWLWRGKNRHRGLSTKSVPLADIRRLFFEGKTLEAGELANRSLGGPGGVEGPTGRVDAYQPVGDLLLRWHLAFRESEQYERTLDLATAVARTAFTQQGVAVERHAFVHAECGLLCVRLAREDDLRLPLDIALRRTFDPECACSPFLDGNRLGLTGRFPEGIAFAMVAEIRSDGTVSAGAGGDGVRAEGFAECEIRLAAAVDTDGGDPMPAAHARLDAAEAEGWASLLASHVAAHRALYDRVELDLGREPEAGAAPQCVERLRGGGGDGQALAELYFHYGRYLTLAASRNPNGTPANLQGK